VTVATWYITTSPPRMAAGADSATKIGAVTIEMPIVTPRKKRATSRKTRVLATPLSTAKPATTIVATHSVCFVERPKSLVMKSSAPEMAPRS
jgi:hypothetical protein